MGRRSLLPPRWLLSLVALLATSPERVESQPVLSWGGQAIGLFSVAVPEIGGRSQSEIYVTQPAVIAHAAFPKWRLEASVELNLERWTLAEGELNAGIHGEGFVDRRHPHTFIHDAVVTLRDSIGRTDVSLTAGKGFVTFGTDDPMVRPFVKYPANHHLAQILERGIAAAALRYGPVILEASTFNGDEPTNPRDFVNWKRFADSWAMRVTVVPLDGLEISGSYAVVESPENPTGGTLDHRKSSSSVRWERGATYGLAEWARTAEFDGTFRAFTFNSALIEFGLQYAAWHVALRAERTLRPEEERLLDPFRTPMPHSDDNIIGATRWNLVTGRLGSELGPLSGVRAHIFVEAQYAGVKALHSPTLFTPSAFYGSSDLLLLSTGLRMSVGTVHRRMGRYGAAVVSNMEHSEHK